MAKVKPTPRSLEKKFEETAFRLTQERNDFVLPQVIDFIQERRWINLRPEYQRRLVWDVEKRSRFIESLLLNIPIPNLFLYEWELGRYEVMDGQQRLNTVVEFYENGYALKGLERWSELNGLRFRDLPETLRRGLDRRRLSATVLLVESGLRDQAQRSDIRKLVFERLNTGGQPLNAQELRNCLYAGNFNELIIQLARYRGFSESWGIPNYEENVSADGSISRTLADTPLYKRMGDCEIVLRFFAFRTKKNIKGSVRSILDDCMEANASMDQKECDALGEIFMARVDLARKIFGTHTFRYKDEHGKLKLSQPLYDAVMVSLDRLWESKTKIIRSKTAVIKQIDRLLSNEEAYADIVGRPNTSRAILRRIDLIEKAIKKGAGI